MKRLFVFVMALMASMTASIGITYGSDAINMSARARVGVEREVLNTSVVVVGAGTREFLAMARGPSMAGSVPGTLDDPILRVVDVATQTVIVEVDDWQDDPAMADRLTDLGLAPTHPNEAATIVSLPAGSYTVQVLGVGGTTGIGQASIRELADHTHFAGMWERFGESGITFMYIIAGIRDDRPFVGAVANENWYSVYYINSYFEDDPTADLAIISTTAHIHGTETYVTYSLELLSRDRLLITLLECSSGGCTGLEGTSYILDRVV